MRKKRELQALRVRPTAFQAKSLVLFLFFTFTLLLFQNRYFLNKLGDLDLLVTDGNSQEETYYDEKSNSNKEDKIGWSFETEPTRESGKRSWEDGHAQENNRQQKPSDGTFDGDGVLLESDGDDDKKCDTGDSHF